MLEQLIIASHNAGKVIEIAELITPLGIKVLSATDANIAEPEETGDTFEANATLKSEHAANACGLPSLADDSGLVVPVIGGAPGIYSARWAGPDKDFAAAFKRIQNELGNKSTVAYFVCVLALTVPGEKTCVFRGEIHGNLTFPPRGNKGFGYDPVFIAHGYDMTFGEMEPAIKNKISHRAIAFEKFLQHLHNCNQ